MFFIDTIIKRFVENRQWQRHVKEFASKLEALTQTNYDALKAMYSPDILPPDIGVGGIGAVGDIGDVGGAAGVGSIGSIGSIGSPDQYTMYEFLAEAGLYANSYRILATEDDVKRVEDLVKTYFTFTEGFLYNRVNEKGQTESLHLVVWDIFAVKKIAIFTNSLAFIQVLKETRIPCPPPWLVFPDLNPLGYVPSQGELEYYDSLFWDPYWSRMSDEEKEHFYATASIPDGWEKELRYRDNHDYD